MLTPQAAYQNTRGFPNLTITGTKKDASYTMEIHTQGREGGAEGGRLVLECSKCKKVLVQFILPVAVCRFHTSSLPTHTHTLAKFWVHACVEDDPSDLTSLRWAD